MAIDIREMMPEERKEVVAFLEAQSQKDGGELSPRKLLRPGHGGAWLSVVAREDDKLVGAVVCAEGENGYRHQVAVAENHRESSLARELLDKALFKLLASGVKRSHIQLPSTTDAAFWKSVRWDAVWAEAA